MKNFFLKPYRWAVVFSVFLMGSFLLTMLDTFVIPKTIRAVVPETTANAETTAQTGTTEQTEPNAQTETATQAETTTQTESASQVQSEPVVTDTSYVDENIKISIETVQEYNSSIYIADIQLKDATYLKTALADNSYGRNIKEATSEMAGENNAILAINGDYYGFRDYGYVLRNGVLYRDAAREAGDDEALVIDNAGYFSIIQESQMSMDALNSDDIWQILSFGPALVADSQVAVDSYSEVSRAMQSNPRTAIGQISDLHYIIIVSDGRTNESAGLSLLELAQVFKDRGCSTAYNLDGGGSATMYFNGNIVNNPTDGRYFGERAVSDIVYIGY